MPRHFGRPTGGPDYGCGTYLLVLLAVWVALWVLTHWDPIS